MTLVEARRWRRFERRWPVMWGEGEPQHAGVTHDVSVGGALILSKRVPKLKRVQLQLQLDEQRSLLLEGRVVRSRLLDPSVEDSGGGFAVEYTRPSPELGVELHEAPEPPKPRPAAVSDTMRGVGSGPTSTVPTRLPLLAEGDELEGTFVVRRLLGAGGMGEVYEAHDRVMNRMVAIKMSHPDLGDEPLEAEARALAAFRDSALPAVHALGWHRGHRFMVMERLPGSTLRATLKRLGPGRPMPLGEALAVLAGAARALGVLHGAGLAHRDFKPGNLMLVPPARVVLLDFGIVRQERHVADDSPSSGSPHYMAPEARRGTVRAGEAHLADLYSLGVIAFELLTGQPPAGNTDTAETGAGPSTQERGRPGAINPEVPPVLDDLVAQLLAHDPHDRTDSIDTVIGTLERLRASL